MQNFRIYRQEQDWFHVWQVKSSASALRISWLKKIVAFIIQMHIGEVHQGYVELIVLYYIRRGESSREPDQEPPPC